MRESVVEDLVPLRGDGVMDNDHFFDRGADLNTAPAVWVSPSKEKAREEKEKKDRIVADPAADPATVSANDFCGVFRDYRWMNTIIIHQKYQTKLKFLQGIIGNLKSPTLVVHVCCSHVAPVESCQIQLPCLSTGARSRRQPPCQCFRLPRPSP